ncbi:MAG: hypothetical protein RR525_10480, partial [Cellulosilyticaceae bacterium]
MILPSFEELTYEKFNELIEENPDDIFFVVFYTDLRIAHSYFKQAAHEYKLKAKIYKSGDVRMFERAGIFPLSADKEGKEEERLELAVYKKGLFHKTSAQITNQRAVGEWLFNSHFPHISKINNENFYTIFHGIKPAIVLFTYEDQYVEKLESVAERMSLG